MQRTKSIEDIGTHESVVTSMRSPEKEAVAEDHRRRDRRLGPATLSKKQIQTFRQHQIETP